MDIFKRNLPKTYGRQGGSEGVRRGILMWEPIAEEIPNHSPQWVKRTGGDKTPANPCALHTLSRDDDKSTGGVRGLAGLWKRHRHTGRAFQCRANNRICVDPPNSLHNPFDSRLIRKASRKPEKIKMIWSGLTGRGAKGTRRGGGWTRTPDTEDKPFKRTRKKLEQKLITSS